MQYPGIPVQVTILRYAFILFAAGCCTPKKSSLADTASPTSNASSTVLWKELSNDQLRMIDIPDTMPSAYSLWILDTLAMQKKLAETGHSDSGKVTIEIPTPGKKFENYRFHSVMTVSKELLDAFPELQTYEAVNVAEQRETGRFDFNRNGFHGYILTLNGTILINPLSQKNKNIYICSYKRDTRKIKGDFEK